MQAAVNPDRENNADADMPDDIDAVMDEPVEVLEPPMVDTPMVDTVKILDPVVAPEENTGTATGVPPLQPQPQTGQPGFVPAQPGVVGEVVAITITVTIITKSPVGRPQQGRGDNNNNNDDDGNVQCQQM